MCSGPFRAQAAAEDKLEELAKENSVLRDAFAEAFACGSGCADHFAVLYEI